MSFAVPHRLTRTACFALGALVAACSSSGGGNAVAPIQAGAGAPTPSPKPSSGASSAPTASPTPVSPTPTPAVSATPAAINCTTPTMAVPATGGTITANTGNFTETFPAGAFSSTADVVLDDIPQSSLPAPLLRARFEHRDGEKRPFFTQGAGNTYVVAFCNNFFGATLSSPASIAGAAGIVPSSIPAGTGLNIAINQSSTWVDVGTATVGSGGTFTSSIPTASLPGVSQAGNYLVYEPASGTSTVSVNLGFALIADDGTAPTVSGLQFVQVEDPSGNAIPTPTTTYLPIPNAGDLDGEGLTPDAQYGSVVDGSNLVYFFSGIPQHSLTLSSNTVDITAYGADGDSIVSLPGGDQAVASGNGAQLAVISGILEGTPVVADAINNPGATTDRDGLVISNDGKLILSRGDSGIDAWAVSQVAAHTGSTGTGTTKFNFALSTTLTDLPAPFGEDGRDEMAISPSDSSRAVLAGSDPNTGNLEIVLVTGLPSAPVVSILRPRLPSSVRRNRSHVLYREPSSHRTPYALEPSGDGQAFAVAITPDGTTAYVSTTAGILTVSGVNTGTLAVSGSPYAPSVSTPGGPFTFAGATSIGILPDGKYLVEVIDSDGDVGSTGSTDSTQGDGILITVPIGAGDVLGAPVGQLNQVVTTFNDQVIVH
jgi:hypothetical protein